jgi:hypothetical protein
VKVLVVPQPVVLVVNAVPTHLAHKVVAVKVDTVALEVHLLAVALAVAAVVVVVVLVAAEAEADAHHARWLPLTYQSSSTLIQPSQWLKLHTKPSIPLMTLV